MFSRTVSLAMIAAVIACPLWCGDGFAGLCCAEGESDLSGVCSHNATSDCCERENRAPEHDDDRQCPCESTACQGICGGAVLEKTVELNHAAFQVIVPLIEEHASVNPQLAECGDHRAGQHCHSHDNYGRIVRTLHMSFLC